MSASVMADLQASIKQNGLRDHKIMIFNKALLREIMYLGFK